MCNIRSIIDTYFSRILVDRHDAKKNYIANTKILDIPEVKYNFYRFYDREKTLLLNVGD